MGKYHSKWFDWFLRSFLVLLFILAFVHFLFYGKFSEPSFARRIQKSIAKTENVTKTLRDQILHSPLVLDGSNKEFDPITNASVQLYVFRSDSLVFWNDNSLEPKILKKRVPIDCDTILHFNSGDYLISSFSKSDSVCFLFTLINTTYPIENEFFINRFQYSLRKRPILLCDSGQEGALPIYSSSGKPLAYYQINDSKSFSFSDSGFLIGLLILALLTVYLLVFRRVVTLRSSALDESDKKEVRPLPFVLLFLLLVVAAFGFTRIFVYGFRHGFFIPESITFSPTLVFYFLAFLVILTLLLLLHRLFLFNHPSFSRFWLLVGCFLSSLLFTHLYNREFNRFEDQKIKSLATTLADERDPDFEQSYQGFLSVAQHDTSFFATVLSKDIMEEVAEDYIRNFLFDSVMNQYNVTLTLCDPGLELVVEPYDLVSDCMGYFQNKVNEYHGVDLGDGLAFLDYHTLDPSYLSMINILTNDTTTDRSLFLEFSKPIAPQGYGLTRLLQGGKGLVPANTSVACYQNGLLVYKYGSYVFPNYLSDFRHVLNDFSYGRKMKHYSYVVDESKVLVISVNRRGWMEKTVPFVFFFVSLMVLYLLVYFAGGMNREVSTTLSRQFQMMVLIALGVSFLIVGPVSVLYMRSVYTQKSNDYHFERTRSLLQDVTSEVDFTFLKQPGFKYELDRILRRYSETFYTDINIYGLDGKLLSTTCPEIQDLHLQASLMNAEAYHNMQGERSLYYIHDEQLGRASYPSAYISIMDGTGSTLAYLNTPYFSSRSGLHSEIVNFVLTYINIIFLIIFLILPFILLLTRRVTYPLVQLQNKMRQIDINKPNELLEWESRDEIGALVKQYNQLVMELEKSAAELRRTATESAWRGAARQVAHEIKNSLTPMRLSIQMLQRAVENHPEDLDQRIKRTSATLIEQIDALSDIASTFSSYAKLPENHPEPLDLAELVGHVVTLHENEENVDFEFIYDQKADYGILADRTNLNSVVTNLVKNAVQAIGTKPEGRVVASLKATDTRYYISVKDNGRGIKEEDKKMIFLPNFTTKTSGSGLGLAYTYKLVHSMGGNISFESEEGEGAEFVVELPKS